MTCRPDSTAAPRSSAGRSRSRSSTCHSAACSPARPPRSSPAPNSSTRSGGRSCNSSGASSSPAQRCCVGIRNLPRRGSLPRAQQLQRARLQRYNAAKSLVEADKAMVYWYADWARFETSPCQSTASTAPTQPAARPGGRALCLWHSAEWLTEGATELGERKLRAIHAAGIERLLVSLDAAQMRRVSADPSSLLRAVGHTHEHGFKVELLLGDPDWIRPEQRAGLLRIIEALKSVPFDGLHLDLEPAQIDPAPDRLPALLGSLAETLVAASAASPWPVALSVHPRDLDAPVGDSSFAEVLHRLRVSPTLMVYVANPDRAVEIAEPLLGHHPELSFSVALSLEKSLGREESLWSYTEAERRRRIERIESQLAAANFSGLTLQIEDAWRDASGLARLAAGE